jgi:DNA-binding XRE family transcriptional regulator
MTNNQKYGEIVASNLRAYRNKYKLSQKELAKKINVHYTTYMSYEKDASTIKFMTMMKLAQIFNCNVNDFFKE